MKKYSFDEIKPWSWFVLQIADGIVTILPINKINDEEFSTFEHCENRSGNNWVEYPSSITKNEWNVYKYNENINLMVTKEHPEWSEHARKAIKLIFSIKHNLL